jgi:hypothetical protein
MSDDVLHVYGASDDLLELVGAVNDEFYPTHPDTLVVMGYCGGRLHYLRMIINYGHDGVWRIRPEEGTPGGHVTITPARGEDNAEGDDEHGCPPYSDRATVTLDEIASVHLLSGKGVARR